MTSPTSYCYFHRFSNVSFTTSLLLIGGFALAQGYEISTILFAAGFPPIVCGLLVLWLNRLASEN